MPTESSKRTTSQVDYDDEPRKLPPVGLALNPRFLMETLVNFMGGWLFSRNYLRLLLALPAVLCGLMAMPLLLQRDSLNQRAVVRRYERRLRESERQDDQAAQEVMLNTLIQAEPDEPQHRFRLGLLRIEQGNVKSGWAIMETLAAPNAAGYAPAHLWIAQQLLEEYQKGKLDSAELAIRHLRRILDQDPLHHRAHEMLAELYVRAKQPLLAAPHLEAASTAEPKHRLLLAQIQQLQGRTEAARHNAQLAETALRDAVAAEPSNPTLRVGWAQSLELLGLVSDSESALRQGLALNSTPEIAIQLSGLLVRSVGKEIVMGLSTPKRHLQQLEEALRLDPLNLAALDMMSRMEGVQLEDADRLLASVKERVAREIEAQPQQPSLYVVASRIASLRGDMPEAVRQLRLAAQLDPACYLLVARALGKLQRVEESRESARLASEHFRQMVEADPDHVSARLQWAASEIILERWASAHSILRDGLFRDDNPRIRSALAEMYCQAANRLEEQGDLQRSVNMLSEAVKAQPDYAPALSHLGRYSRQSPVADQANSVLLDLLRDGQATFEVHSLLGANAADAGRMEEAVRHLEQANQRGPRNPIVCNNLAHALANLPNGDWERALTLAEIALELLPGHYEVLETRGEVLMRLGRWHEAIRDLEQALADSPNTERLHRRLAEAYTRLGDEEMAARHRVVE